MSYSSDEMTYIINPALDRIAAAQVTFADQTTQPALVVLRHYEQTRDALLRSFLWPWATAQAELSIISTLVLDTSPTSAWSAGDTITGITSGTTAEILSATTDVEYEIIYLDGDFTAGETITNATVSTVSWEGIPVTYEGGAVYSYSTSSSYQVNCGTGYPTVATSTPNHKWTYQYYLPDDFIRLVNVYEDDGYDAPNVRWERQGRRLLTDYSEVNIEYIQDKTDPTTFDELFTELFILKLAHKLINILAGSASQKYKDELREELRMTEARARVVSAQENNVSGYDSFNMARHGS